VVDLKTRDMGSWGWVVLLFKHKSQEQRSQQGGGSYEGRRVKEDIAEGEGARST